MLTAAEARSITQASNSANKITAEFVQLALAEIEKAALAGESSTKKKGGRDHNKNVIRSNLESLGYQLDILPGEFPGWFVAKISW